MIRNGFRAYSVVQLFCALCAAIGCGQFLLKSLLPFVGAEGFLFLTRAGDFALSAHGVASGAVWQTVSYAFFHGSFIHLTLNLVALLMTGAALEGCLGRERMKWLLLFGIVGGAIGFLGSLALDPRLPSQLLCIGASGAVTACLGAVTALVPREKVTLWLVVVPIPLRAFWLLPLLLGLFICEAIWYPATTAYGAHLGGYVAGLFFVKTLK